jgi:hypothetical protein
MLFFFFPNHEHSSKVLPEHIHGSNPGYIKYNNRQKVFQLLQNTNILWKPNDVVVLFLN